MFVQEHLTHTPPWDLSCCTPRCWGRWLMPLCSCSPSALKGHGDQEVPMTGERQMSPLPSEKGSSSLRSCRPGGLPPAPGKTKERVLLEPTPGHMREQAAMAAARRELLQVNRAWPTWLPAATASRGWEESSRCRLPLLQAFSSAPPASSCPGCDIMVWEGGHAGGWGPGWVVWAGHGPRARGGQGLSPLLGVCQPLPGYHLQFGSPAQEQHCQTGGRWGKGMETVRLDPLSGEERLQDQGWLIWEEQWLWGQPSALLAQVGGDRGDAAMLFTGVSGGRERQQHSWNTGGQGWREGEAFPPGGQQRSRGLGRVGSLQPTGFHAWTGEVLSSPVWPPMLSLFSAWAHAHGDLPRSRPAWVTLGLCKSALKSPLRINLQDAC